jgi:hypothetical protein
MSKQVPDPLELRRRMLVARCDIDRHDAADAIDALRHPPAGSGLLAGASVKLPLAIAGVVLGMVAIKPQRTMAIISTGLTLWKVANGVLATLRGPAAHGD